MRMCVHASERARQIKELNEPTRGPNLANFLKTHLRPVFLLSERPPLKSMKVLLRNRGEFSRRVLEGRPSLCRRIVAAFLQQKRTAAPDIIEEIFHRSYLNEMGQNLNHR